MPRGRQPVGRSNEKNSNRGKNSSIVIGRKVNAGVVSWKGADLTVAKWIGRAALGTTENDIRATVESNGADVVSVEAIETKHGRFASFKLVVKKLLRTAIYGQMAFS